LTDSLVNTKVAVVSRCARTLHTFRRSLIHSLNAAGAQVVALGSAGEGYESLLESEGIRFQHVPVSPRGVDPLGDLRLLATFVRLFRRARPDVMHAFTIKPAIYATLAAAWAGVPKRIVTVTGLGHAFTTASGFVRRVTEFLYRRALARAQVVFFQNADDRELFVARRIVDPAIARLVPGSGIDLARFAPAPLPGTAAGGIRFLMIARLLEEKGVREYLAAAEVAKQQLPAATWRLVGGQDPRNPSALGAREVEALRMSGTVQWIDEVLDVRPYIEQADVIVLPSYREGLPRALLEGAAMGRALIATDVPGCRDVVSDGENGYLVPRGDSAALARAMVRMAADPGLPGRFGASARRRVEERFDERLVHARTIAAYLET